MSKSVRNRRRVLAGGVIALILGLPATPTLIAAVAAPHQVTTAATAIEYGL